MTIASVVAGAVLTAGATVPITIDASANRVPVTHVDFAVNGVVLSGDDTDPFEFLFTVPAGVRRAHLQRGRDRLGREDRRRPRR